MTVNQPSLWKSVPPKGPLLRPPQAAAYLGIAVSTYYALAKSGDLPKPVKLFQGGRSSGVPKNQLDALISDRSHRAES